MLASPTFASSQSLIQLAPLARHWARIPARRSRASAPGAGHSRHKGRGLDFAEVRSYFPGDDIRTIDWKITARKGRTHTRLYTEERERPVMIVCDLTASQFFGSRTQFKSVLSVQAAAFCAWMAMEQGDRVGGLIFNELAHQEQKPVMRQQGVLRLLHWLEQYQHHKEIDPNDIQVSFHERINQLARLVKPGSRVLIFSDFLHLDSQAEQALQQLASHSSVQGFQIFDAMETELPEPGQYPVIAGTKAKWLDSRQRKIRERFRQMGQQQHHAIQYSFQHIGARLVSLPCDQTIEHYLPQLAEAMS